MKKVHVFVAVNRKVSLSIHKARGEYRVRLYTTARGFVVLAGEYFTDDLHDARATAAHQLKWARRNSALRNIGAPSIVARVDSCS